MGKIEIFKFNLVKWRNILNNLNDAEKNNKIVTNGKALIKECRLDLIEALSEYNVAEKCLNPEFSKEVNLLHRFFIFIALTYESPLSSWLIDAFKEANLSEKVFLSIWDIYSGNAISPWTIAFKKESDGFSSFYCSCAFWDKSNAPWSNGKNLNVEHLIGKRNGDRIIFQGEAQFIIRINQNAFERILVNGISKKGVEYTHKGRLLQDQIQKAYNIEKKPIN